MSGQLHVPTALLSGKNHGTNCWWGWVDPRAGIIMPVLGIEPQILGRPGRSHPIALVSWYAVDK